MESIVNAHSFFSQGELCGSDTKRAFRREVPRVTEPGLLFGGLIRFPQAGDCRAVFKKLYAGRGELLIL